MFNKIKSIARDAIWLTIGTIATLCYVSYKAGKSIKDDVPEMMDFAQDTYGQVKNVLSKNDECDTRIADDSMEESLIRAYRPDLVKGLEILTKPWSKS
tara:strand:+ start:52 stop:345 length:294 start_codon:yes stop_codon:yes gene_type:complete